MTHRYHIVALSPTGRHILTQRHGAHAILPGGRGESRDRPTSVVADVIHQIAPGFDLAFGCIRNISCDFARKTAEWSAFVTLDRADALADARLVWHDAENLRERLIYREQCLALDAARDTCKETTGPFDGIEWEPNVWRWICDATGWDRQQHVRRTFLKATPFEALVEYTGREGTLYFRGGSKGDITLASDIARCAPRLVPPVMAIDRTRGWIVCAEVSGTRPDWTREPDLRMLVDNVVALQQTALDDAGLRTQLREMPLGFRDVCNALVMLTTSQSDAESDAQSRDDPDWSICRATIARAADAFARVDWTSLPETLIHPDLAPDNVFLTGERCVIIDFEQCFAAPAPVVLYLMHARGYLDTALLDWAECEFRGAWRARGTHLDRGPRQLVDKVIAGEVWAAALACRQFERRLSRREIHPEHRRPGMRLIAERLSRRLALWIPRLPG